MKKFNLRFINLWTAILMLVGGMTPCITHIEKGIQRQHSIFEEMLGRTVSGYELGSFNYFYLIIFFAAIFIFVGWIKRYSRPSKIIEAMGIILLVFDITLYYQLWSYINENTVLDYQQFNYVFYVEIALNAFLLILTVGDLLGLIMLDVYEQTPKFKQNISQVQSQNVVR